MSEVKMSLEEYDEMKEELLMYRRLFEELTTPSFEDWALKYSKNHPEYEIKVLGFLNSPDLINIMRELVLKKIGSVQELDDYEFVLEDMSIYLGKYVKRIEDSEEEESSDI